MTARVFSAWEATESREKLRVHSGSFCSLSSSFLHHIPPEFAWVWVHFNRFSGFAAFFATTAERRAHVVLICNSAYCVFNVELERVCYAIAEIPSVAWSISLVLRFHRRCRHLQDHRKVARSRECFTCDEMNGYLSVTLVSLPNQEICCGMYCRWVKGQTDDLASMAALDEHILLAELEERYKHDQIYVCTW